MRKPIPIYFLWVLHLVLCSNGLAGGFLFMISPDGELLGMSTRLLHTTPFTDYFLPGLILAISNGFLPLIVLFALMFRPGSSFFNVLNLYPDVYWGWSYSLYVGIISISWTVVELMMINYFWIQSVVIIIGLLIIIFTMMPSVIYYFKIENMKAMS